MLHNDMQSSMISLSGVSWVKMLAALMPQLENSSP